MENELRLSPADENFTVSSRIEKKYSHSFTKMDISTNDKENQEKVSILVTEPRELNLLEKTGDALRKRKNGQKQILVIGNGDVYEVRTNGQFSERNREENLADVVGEIPVQHSWNYGETHFVRQAYKGTTSDTDNITLKYIGRYQDPLDPKRTAEKYLMLQLD